MVLPSLSDAFWHRFGMNSRRPSHPNTQMYYVQGFVGHLAFHHQPAFFHISIFWGPAGWKRLSTWFRQDFRRQTLSLAHALLLAASRVGRHSPQVVIHDRRVPLAPLVNGPKATSQNELLTLFWQIVLNKPPPIQNLKKRAKYSTLIPQIAKPHKSTSKSLKRANCFHNSIFFIVSSCSTSSRTILALILGHWLGRNLDCPFLECQAEWAPKGGASKLQCAKVEVTLLTKLPAVGRFRCSVRVRRRILRMHSKSGSNSWRSPRAIMTV